MTQKQARTPDAKDVVGPQVLTLLSNVELGGIAVQARGLAIELLQRGIATELLLLSDQLGPGEMNWYSQVIPTRVASDNILKTSGLRRFVNWFRYFRTMPEQIVHFHSMSQEYIYWQAVLAARAAGKSVVVTLHHTVNWNRSDRLGLFAQRLAWLAADALIVTTHASKTLICQRVPSSKVEVIPCGISVQVPTKSRLDARKCFKYTEDDFVVIAAGRISRYKGFFDLLKSVEELSSSFPCIKLLIAGNGQDFEELSRCAQGKSYVQLAGRVENLSDVIVAGDVFAMPSYEEGFGLVYGEAGLLGLSSIGGRLAQVEEVILDGETGWLVTPGDVSELKLVLSRLVVDRGKCREAGRRAERHCRKFEMSEVVDQLESLYHRKFASRWG